MRDASERLLSLLHVTGKSLGLLVSGPESAIAHDALLAHAWVVPPSVSIDRVRVEASKFVYRPPGCDPQAVTSASF